MIQESYLPSKTFSDKKQTMFLSITPHFLRSGNFMARDFMFSFDRQKPTTKYVGTGEVVGRFLNPDKIKIEKGELTDKEMKYLKRIAKILCRK